MSCLHSLCQLMNINHSSASSLEVYICRWNKADIAHRAPQLLSGIIYFHVKRPQGNLSIYFSPFLTLAHGGFSWNQVETDNSVFLWFHVCPLGRAGYLWPGLNSPVYRDGSVQKPSQRGEAEQKEVTAALERQRDEWDKRRKTKIKRERGWTGFSWGGISLGPPDPGPNGGVFVCGTACDLSHSTENTYLRRCMAV